MEAKKINIKKIFSDSELTFQILVVFLILATIGPSIVPRSSIRIDTLLIFMIFPFIILLSGKKKIDLELFRASNRFLFLAVLSFLAVFFQVLFEDVALNIRSFMPAQGFLRVYLFFFFSVLVIDTPERASKIVKLFIILLFFHAFLTFFEYFQIQPIEKIIRIIYRNQEFRKLRAIGIFGSVHSLAYFFVYGAIITFIFQQVTQSKKTLIIFFLATLAMIFPFSLAAYLAYAAGLGFFLIFNWKKSYYIYLLLFIIFLLVLVSFLPPIFINKISKLFELFSFILGEELAGKEITGRLEGGWYNAYITWIKSPFFGNRDASEKIFIGDGGYSAVLANLGIFVFLAYLYAYVSFVITFKRLRSSCPEVKYISFGGISLVIVWLIANLATFGTPERTMELFPILMSSLFIIGRKYEIENEAKKI